MGRRKIEIKAIKDDRNRSVTFLKRKGGLFKKAHELSVLCSVDVAVFVFGSNKKLYEYSSSSMPELINRYHYHGGPNEHKGPSDFNGGADDDGSDDENASPPQIEVMESHMPLNFHGQPPFPHPHMRHHTPSASPPIQNGAFVPHPAHPIHRGHTPQPPHMGSRPSSRNDMRRMGPNMGQPNGGPVPHHPQQVNGYAYMPQPAIYNPQNQQNMNHGMPQPGAPYAYPPQQAHAHQMQAYMEEQRRASLPPNFPPPPQHGLPHAHRHSVSPPQPSASQLPAQAMAHMSPPPPQHHSMQSPPLPQQPQQQQQQQQQTQNRQSQPQQQQQQQENHQPPTVHVQEPLAPPLPEVKQEPSKSMRQPPLLDTQVKRLPQRKGGSIFTPIDGPSSILAQHLSAFHSASDPSKSDGNRSNPTSSPPQPPPRSNVEAANKRHNTVISIPERTFTPPSRTNSLVTPGGAARPRLKVQIPEEASEAGSATVGSSSSPRNTSTDNTSQQSRVLPPPSPSVDAGSLLSAGATGPPNPFARPVRQDHQSMNIDTPVSALPSRFMGNEFLPSPSSFYPDWNFRGNESNTLPSPLNFATPVVGTGPSFLRDETTPHKRKSPEISGSHGSGLEGPDHGNEPKRIKVDS
ncbi:MADS-box MEF2 type transcription factor [Coniochaeta hoffmannii]|uniref:MADS-box MEF2 type transcription factor n=1 Tax=Coniochaeta hoffmannii TaxID=91930 RepID=A0AA38RWV0_9PEZI|nr:MADS-box MEF2 type transcription factor [Coniochaeta hoffmannii]